MVERRPAFKENPPKSYINMDVWLPFYMSEDIRDYVVEELSSPEIEMLNVTFRSQEEERSLVAAGVGSGAMDYGGLTGERPRGFLNVPQNFIQISTQVLPGVLEAVGATLTVYEILGHVSKNLKRINQQISSEFEDTSFIHHMELGDDVSLDYRYIGDEKAYKHTMDKINKMVRVYYSIK